MPISVKWGAGHLSQSLRSESFCRLIAMSRRATRTHVSNNPTQFLSNQLIPVDFLRVVAILIPTKGSYYCRTPCHLFNL